MAGRSSIWFLEEGLSKAVYDKHKLDVEQSVRKNTWRAIYRLYVDFRLWEKGKVFQSLFAPIASGWYGQAQPHWVHFGDIAGKTMFLHAIDNQDYLRFITSDTNQTIDIPVKAIVSTESAGFPKVAYSVDQYLVGYLGWLDALEEANQGDWESLTKLQSQLFAENFTETIYARIKDLSRYLLSESHPANEIKMFVQSLQDQMVLEMEQVIPTRCKPPYHHVIEWHVEPSVLKRNHPIINMYFTIRKKIPNMVLGNSFIEVSDFKKTFN